MTTLGQDLIASAWEARAIAEGGAEPGRVFAPMGENATGCVLAARSSLAVLPTLLREAEAAGAVMLARHLGQALAEAEGIVRRLS